MIFCKEESTLVKIIGISGIGGAGKSVLTKALGAALNVTTLFWDDFDEISESPKDYIEWYNTSRDYTAWKYDVLENILKQLKSDKKIICPVTKKELIPTDYIVFDAPLGRKHVSTGQYIDFSIFLNTPLDICLARRMLRDYRDKKNLNITDIFDQLDFYINVSRPLYVMDYEEMEKFDFIIDGSLPVDQLVCAILERINDS